jgi:hypothetical protein
MTRHQEKFLAAWNDLRVADARLRNRDPAPLSRIREENAELARRIEEAERRLFPLLESDARHPDDELLRLKTLEFIQTLKVDPELWQSLASS